MITWIFLAEMIVKLLALGCGGYWRDKWNVLDGSITLLACAETTLEIVAVEGGLQVPRALPCAPMSPRRRHTPSWHTLRVNGSLSLAHTHQPGR